MREGRNQFSRAFPPKTDRFAIEVAHVCLGLEDLLYFKILSSEPLRFN